MKIFRIVVCYVSAVVLFTLAAPFWAQTRAEGSGVGRSVVTVLPKVDGQLPSSVTQQDLAVKIDGKRAKVTSWASYQAPNNEIELVLLIDGGARSSIGRQWGDIEKFVNGLPPNAKAAIAYMQNGEAKFAGPLAADHAEILKNLHLPLGMAGISGSPYFCLSNLAKKWPGQSADARREVVMITDGVDNYERRYDPDDPYVQTAIADATRAHLVVFSIYWMNQGWTDRTEYAASDGQNLLMQVAEATGGKSFWQGMGNPVSFQPYFDELSRRLRNQYELGFIAPASVPSGVVDMKLSLHAPGTEINSPRRVLVVSGEPAPK
jgi:hypothetical protein